MRKYYFTILALIFCFYQANAKYTFWVVFTDKDSSHFTLDNPSEFLNENALQRRIFFGIPIDITDIPVPDFYLQRVKSLDADIQHVSKWLNGAVVFTENENFAQEVSELYFVKEVRQIKLPGPKSVQDKLKYEQQHFRNLKNNNVYREFGASENQLSMLFAHTLHERGLKGNGIDIAVMDNGFVNVPDNPFFATPYSTGRINAGYNFVDNTPEVFTKGNHGSAVLSTLAADKQGNFMGAAPNANYYLFITEDDLTEGIHEEINWALAAEMVDTMLGIHVILSTSLGYSDGFDNPADEYTYADMDGNTTIITRAANLAASKGMLVVNSAGNSGTSPWRYITAPADGPGVLAVGAVGPDGLVTPFSSRGPNAARDLKPNVMAQGGMVAVVNQFGSVVASNGTSFSCPIISGMAACLWQDFPEKSSHQIFKAIQKSAHLYNKPNNDYGYGIPNFRVAYELLRTDFNLDTQETFLVYPNPFESNLHVVFYFIEDDKYDLAIFDLLGKKWFSKKNITNGYHILEEVGSLPAGNYLLRIKRGRDVVEEKLIKY
jgi:serine protease AprX